MRSELYMRRNRKSKRKSFYKNRWFIIVLLFIPTLFLIKIARERRTINEQRDLLIAYPTQGIEVTQPVNIQEVFMNEQKIVVETQDNEEATIKGASSGIYHTTESAHYTRIKNVAEWFHSIEEAELAGYRAPKK